MSIPTSLWGLYVHTDYGDFDVIRESIEKYKGILESTRSRSVAARARRYINSLTELYTCVERVHDARVGLSKFSKFLTSNSQCGVFWL